MNLLFLAAESALVAALVLALFRLRTHFGLSLLYLAIGAFQPIQVTLSTAVYVDLMPGMPVSPGSAVLFTASLFAVLLVYIHRDASEARKLIYGLLAANLTLSLLYVLFDFHFRVAGVQGSLGPSAPSLLREARVMVAGTVVLFVDALLVVIVYQAIRPRVGRSLFIRSYASIAIVLAFDSAAFSVAAFLGEPEFSKVLFSGFAGKLLLASVYAAAFACYVRFVEPVESPHGTKERVRDVFDALTYRQKYELEQEQTKKTESYLHASQARLHAVVNHAVEAFITIDDKGEVDSFNPAAERMFGYAEEEVVGKNVRMLMPSPHREAHDGYLERYLRTGEARIIGNGREMEALAKGGETFVVDFSVSEIWVDGERMFSGILRDLTERKLLERESLQAQKMEAIGRLASGVAHDFNNLLAGIKGGLDILSSDVGPAHSAVEFLDQLKGEVDRGTSITRRLLDFSRVSKPSQGPLNPRKTLTESERMIQRLIGEDVAVRIVVDDASSRIFGDAGQLEQAILNLAINSRDAMPHGGELEIRCSDVDLSSEDLEQLGATVAPGAFVVISVRDTGYGMDADTLANALDAFFTTKGPGLGTGLGLHSVARMMNEGGGHLALDSEVGAGTTIRLFFPRLSGEAAPEEEEVTIPDVAPSSASGETVLIVEDDTLVRLGIQHLLKESGYVVTTAKDPKAALEEIESNGRTIDLLLTDVMMPIMSGPELAALVVEREPTIRILYMSAFSADDLVRQGRVDPGTVTLEKPFTGAELATRVRQALAGVGHSRTPQ